MLSSTLPFLLLAASQVLARLPSVTPVTTEQTIYAFPPSLRASTAIENQAFRPDGSVLLTSYTNGSVWQLSPPFSHPTLTLITDFAFDPTVTATLGIVETTPDTFYVLTSHFNASFANFTAAPHSAQLYELAFPGPRIRRAARIPGAAFLNGLAPLNATYLLAADSPAGAIWGIDTRTGASRRLVVDTQLAPYPALGGVSGFGINGLKRHGNWLYFTNTIRSSMGRVAMGADARVMGPVQTVANFSVPGVDVRDNVQPDDLVVRADGTALVALRSKAQIASVDAAGRVRIVADLGAGRNMTSLSFGRATDGASVFATGVFGEYFEVDLGH